ncbi:MAG TPA: pyrimidine 5'-nucleotidase [Desulfomonilia bacterium]
MKLILVDVDYTLYPKGTGPFRHVNQRIEDYVMSSLSMEREHVKLLRNDYIRNFGSTLGGMMRNHNTDPYDFIRNVHDVPVEDILFEDEMLKEALSAISLPMIAFTNASRDYASRVLNALGVKEYFVDIFSIEDMDFIPKPLAAPYEKVVERYGCEPSEVIFVDDRADNVETAQSLGMHGILLGIDPGVDAEMYIQNIYELPDAVERLTGLYGSRRR